MENSSFIGEILSFLASAALLYLTIQQARKAKVETPKVEAETREIQHKIMSEMGEGVTNLIVPLNNRIQQLENDLLERQKNQDAILQALQESVDCLQGSLEKLKSILATLSKK